MINKIQQYLLTNQPTIWNTKLVPIVLLTIAIQIAFFAFGYLATNNGINYKDGLLSGMYILVYAGSLLVGLLLFIFWLLQYNRNNGLKVFYPTSNLNLYLEWICILIVCIFIGYIPNSLSQGKATKWKQAISKSDQKEAFKKLNRAQALLPSSIYNFELGVDQQPMMVGDAPVNRTKFDTKLYTYEENATSPNNPIEYVGPSYLYYKDNKRNSYWRYDEEDAAIVEHWLKTQNKDSIRMVMQDFLDLHTKYNLKTNVDIDYWMETVYNPPLYPVTKTIGSNEYIQNSYSSYDDENPDNKYLNLDTLYNYYEEVNDYYSADGYSKWYNIITLTFALGISVLVFSSRVTSGRHWVFALLCTGVILFVFSLLSGLILLIDDGLTFPLIMPLCWLILFVAICFAIALKVVNSKQKGKSNIYMNLAIWMIPALIPWTYQIFVYFQIFVNENWSDTVVDFTYIMLYANIVFTLIVMFPAVMLIRKWKALPED